MNVRSPLLAATALAAILAGPASAAGPSPAAPAQAPAAQAAPEAPRAVEPEGYKLEPGVVLEVSAVGIPEFRYKVAVNANGVASFPLLPPMRVAGTDIAVVRERVRDALSRKVFRTRGVDGRDTYVNISGDEVTIEVAEYRPVYVNGDVARPGEVVFRPGMTVRQAIAIAGGFDLLHQRVSNPFMESADVRAESEGTWTEYERQVAANVATQASLDGRPDADIRKALNAPLAPAVLDAIARTESARLKASEEDFKKETGALRDGIASIERQVATLKEQQVVLQTAVKTQTSDFERIRGLFDKNVVAINRMSDEQRQLSYASERLLQCTAQISQAEVSLTEARRKLQAASDQRRIKLLGDLQEGTSKANVLKARIGALDEKLVYTGAARSQILGRRGERPDITIHRRGDSGPETVVANEDEVLRSGDVVEVSVRNPYAGYLKTGERAAIN